MFRELFQTAPDAMIVVDRGGRIVRANPQAERLFGFGESELLGQPVEMLMPQAARHAHRAHVLGYTGAVNGDDKKKDKTLVDDDIIGRTGLQAQYDAYLRGVDGKQTMLLDPRGDVQGTGDTVQPVQGDTLVTSIDADLQKLVEQSILQQIADSRSKGHPATSASVVVMDPNTGRVLAAASYPTYDPSLFIGGISAKDYQRLTDPARCTPLAATTTVTLTVVKLAEKC